MTEFTLLQQLSKSLEKPQDFTLDKLKTETEAFRTLHNEVTAHIWQLQKLIGESSSHHEHSELKKELEKLQKLLATCNSEAQIAGLINEIQVRETAEHGSSRVGGSSPYTL
jgi:transposase-like protein